MDEKVHIIPNGSISLCGIKTKNGTSLGLTCTCDLCYKIGEDLIKKHGDDVKNG